VASPVLLFLFYFGCQEVRTAMRRLAGLLCAVGWVSLAAQAKPTPAEARFFTAHPAEHVALPANKPAAVIHDKGFRTRLRWILKGKPNFADHLRIEDWGCGTGCIMIGVADLTTGETYLFPYTLSVPMMGRRLMFSAHSNAVHMVGYFDEKRPADRWYVWRDGPLVLEKQVVLPEACFTGDDSEALMPTAKCNHQPPTDAEDDS